MKQENTVYTDEKIESYKTQSEKLIDICEVDGDLSAVKQLKAAQKRNLKVMHDSRKVSLKEAIIAQSKTKKVKTKHKSNGFILYEGASRLDPSQNIVAIVTNKSANPKTGNMAQLWILTKDINPLTASKEKKDNAICGGCSLRQSLGGACYVTIFQAPNNIWKTYKKGNYDKINTSDYHKHFLNVKMRFGAYGDPAAIPLEILTTLKAYVSNNTSYTHQWKEDASQGLKSLSMASVDNDKEAKEATKKGWRYFRVSKEDEPLLDNEIVCPNVTTGISCIDCGLCNGSKIDDKRKSIVIPVHGIRAGRF